MRPTITTIDGRKHELKKLTGRTYRVVAEFDANMPQITDVDFIERHAALAAELYGVTQDEILDMPLEDILPATTEARRLTYSFTWLKVSEIAKNSDTDKAQ